MFLFACRLGLCPSVGWSPPWGARTANVGVQASLNAFLSFSRTCTIVHSLHTLSCAQLLTNFTPNATNCLFVSNFSFDFTQNASGLRLITVLENTRTNNHKNPLSYFGCMLTYTACFGCTDGDASSCDSRWCCGARAMACCTGKRLQTDNWGQHAVPPQL